MKDKQTELELFAVQEDAKLDREIRSRWQWVEPSVWTERMLTALEKGVKGGKWFSLIDKVYSMDNLHAASAKVIQNRGSAGVDNQTVEMYETNRNEYNQKMHQILKDDEYKPKGIKRVWIPKPGKKQEKRPLGIPAVRDRLVQTALRNVIEPIFEKDFAEHSYGFRPGRGCKDALRRVDTLLKEGYNWVLDADIKGYFDTIPHDELMARVEEKIADGRVLKLIGQYLEQEIMETCQSWMPEQGTPQGAIISPLLSNIYLDPFYKLMSAKGYEMVRYADDFVIFCKTVSDASKALKLIREWMSEAKLTLHPEKTRIVDATQPGGFDFLGYHFERGYRWPGDRSRKKLKDKIRAKTKRTNGHSLKCIIADVNQSLEGWFEYFKHGNKHTYPRLDKWIRMRLRSILRKRQGKRGRGKGYDHLRWPNVYFAELGLFSLKAAWIEASQSARR